LVTANAKADTESRFR